MEVKIVSNCYSDWWNEWKDKFDIFDGKIENHNSVYFTRYLIIIIDKCNIVPWFPAFFIRLIWIILFEWKQKAKMKWECNKTH